MKAPVIFNKVPSTPVLLRSRSVRAKVTFWKRGGPLRPFRWCSLLNRLVKGTFEKGPFHGSKPLLLGRLLRVAVRNLSVTS